MHRKDFKTAIPAQLEIRKIDTSLIEFSQNEQKSKRNHAKSNESNHACKDQLAKIELHVLISFKNHAENSGHDGRHSFSVAVKQHSQFAP